MSRCCGDGSVCLSLHVVNVGNAIPVVIRPDALETMAAGMGLLKRPDSRRSRRFVGAMGLLKYKKIDPFGSKTLQKTTCLDLEDGRRVSS